MPKPASAAAPVIVWFRQDLRLADNPALRAAIESKQPVICLYILDDETPGRWRIGGAGRWWLHHSLQALSTTMAKLGGALTLRRGAAEQEIPRIVAESGATGVYWNRCYEPLAIARDTAIKQQLGESGVDAQSFSASLLFEPWTVKTGAGEPFKVFTPFWRACLKQGGVRAPLPAPKKINAAPPIASDTLEDWSLLPTKPNWARGFDLWRPGEAGARALLTNLIDDKLDGYPDARDRPDVDGTSRLSPHLHWGEISPVQIWSALHALEPASASRGADKCLSEIGWREFSHHLLYHWPHLPERNWRGTFDAFAWSKKQDGLAAWREGRTGYPLVDAGMRQLWTTGWMHNRVRMVTASFLIKHLLIDWRIGADWFWDTLVDADLANNSASWQWVAGCGADAAPYFRIFNPVAQGERFDPQGDYVRRFVPELARLPAPYIHQPWTAPEAVLKQAALQLGRDYPLPVVDHAFARARALESYAALKSAG